MNIKTYMAIAVAALTAACTQTNDVPADENTAAPVELNDDGSVKTDVEVPANEAAAAGTAVAPVGQQHQL